jgi:hypothetical protein
MTVRHSAWVASLALVLAGTGLGQSAHGYDHVRKPVKPAGGAGPEDHRSGPEAEPGD